MTFISNPGVFLYRESTSSSIQVSNPPLMVMASNFHPSTTSLPIHLLFSRCFRIVPFFIVRLAKRNTGICLTYWEYLQYLIAHSGKERKILTLFNNLMQFKTLIICITFSLQTINAPGFLEIVHKL